VSRIVGWSGPCIREIAGSHPLSSTRGNQKRRFYSRAFCALQIQPGKGPARKYPGDWRRIRDRPIGGPSGGAGFFPKPTPPPGSPRPAAWSRSGPVTTRPVPRSTWVSPGATVISAGNHDAPGWPGHLVLLPRGQGRRRGRSGPATGRWRRSAVFGRALSSHASRSGCVRTCSITRHCKNPNSPDLASGSCSKEAVSRCRTRGFSRSMAMATARRSAGRRRVRCK